MIYTFGNLKDNELIKQISGVVPNSARFKALVNDAVDRLLRRGDSSGTVIPIQVCVTAGCIVMPRYVSTIREAKLCDGTILIKNQFYSFVERDWYNHCNFLEQCDRSLVAFGRVPTYRPIIGTGRTVRVYAQANADHGKTVTIFGVDNNNQPLMHRDVDTGEWLEGWVLTLKPGYTETTGYVSRIDRVIKERTQKPITMFAWNAADSVLEDLAVYDPGEENPNFARYKLNMPMLENSDGTERLRSVTALIKVQYTPVEFDTDLVLINNIQALRFMIEGILLEAGTNDAAAQNKIGKAIQELNFQVLDENFNNQISVNANSVGYPIFSPI